MFVKSYQCTTSLILELAHTFWHVETTSISRINFLPILLLHVIISFKYEKHFKVISWNYIYVFVFVYDVITIYFNSCKWYTSNTY